MSPLSIRLIILRVLQSVEPYALPFETVLSESNRLARPGLTSSELREHLSWLLDRMMVDFIPDAMDPDNQDARKWLIKEAGAAALKK